MWSWQRLRVIECGIVVGLIICQRLDLVGLISLCWKKRMISWGILVAVDGSLHDVINFSGC
jgi:hypothetical protein